MEVLIFCDIILLKRNGGSLTGKLVRKENEEDKYLMFNKPSGSLTARSDENDKTIFDILPNDLKEKYTLFPVGRLDKDTEGLILLTNDGLFNHKVIHKDSNVKKVYRFYALGKLDKKKVKALQKGMILEDSKEKVKTKPFKVKTLKTWKYKDARSILPDVAWTRIRKEQRPDSSFFLGEITLWEGKKHEVKRILKGLDCYVVYLKRIQIGKIKLDKKLEKGKTRDLTKREIKSFK